MLPDIPFQPSDFSALFSPIINAPVTPSANNCNNKVIYVIAAVVVIGVVAYAIHQNTQYNYILESLDKQNQENIELRKTIRLQLAAQNNSTGTHQDNYSSQNKTNNNENTTEKSAQG